MLAFMQRCEVEPAPHVERPAVPPAAGRSRVSTASAARARDRRTVDRQNRKRPRDRLHDPGARTRREVLDMADGRAPSAWDRDAAAEEALRMWEEVLAPMVALALTAHPIIMERGNGQGGWALQCIARELAELGDERGLQP